MIIYNSKYAIIAFENGQMTAEAKMLHFTLEEELDAFFAKHDSFTLDGVQYMVKVKDNAYTSERYIHFTTECETKPDWLVVIHYGYRLAVENLSKLDRNCYSEVSAIGDHKYLVLIPEGENDNLATYLDEGFFYQDYDVITVEGEDMGYYRKYIDATGYQVWITYAEYGRIKAGLPVVLEGTMIS